MKKPVTPLNCIEIKENMGWCNDIRFPKQYNKLIKIDKKIGHEKLKRNDTKYDLIIPINIISKSNHRKRKLYFYSFNKKL